MVNRHGIERMDLRDRGFGFFVEMQVTMDEFWSLQLGQLRPSIKRQSKFAVLILAVAGYLLLSFFVS